MNITMAEVQELGIDVSRNYYTFRYQGVKIDVPRRETFAILFDMYTRDDLRKMARRLGVKTGSGPTKAEIAMAIQLHHIARRYDKVNDYGHECGGDHTMYRDLSLCPRCGS